MKRKLSIHIGCTYSKEPILKGLIATGIELVVVDEIGIRPTDLNLEYHSVFGQSYEQIIATIQNIVQKHYLEISDCTFFTLAEGSVDLLNRICKEFGKLPVSERSETLRDKYWVRKSLEKSGLEKLDYIVLAHTLSDIPDAGPSVFPLIVKPIGSMASRNVSKVQNQDELRKACIEIFTKNKTYIKVDHGEIIIEDVYGQLPHALIESCLTGEKLSLEALIINKKNVFSCVTSKFDANNDFFYERADIVDPNYFSPEAKRKIDSYIQTIVDSLEVVSSILHIEVFYNRADDTFSLIEVNFRMGGDNIHELVEKACGVNLVGEFLRLSSEPTATLREVTPQKKAWIAYYFMTGSGGEFYAKQNTAFGYKIEWDYQNGESISKFTTSKFFKVGTVVFSCASHEVKTRLEKLLQTQSDFFTLRGPDSGSSWAADRFSKSKQYALSWLKGGLIVLYLATCALGSFYIYQSYVAQARHLGQTMSKTMAYHISNGEIYYVGNIVENFQEAQNYGRIAVADGVSRVIYASASTKPFGLLYQEKIRLNDYDESIPIVVDGIQIGSLVFDYNYNSVILQLLVWSLLISGVVAVLYFVIAKYLFNRVAVAAQKEAENFISVVNQLKSDLNYFHEKNAVVSFEKYDDLLKEDTNDQLIFGDLKPSLHKLVGVLRELRNGILVKNRLADLLDESTKQLVAATTQAEIAKVATQVSHDIRSPLSALDIVLMDLSTLPEDKRILVRSATQRIKDIANNLIAKHKMTISKATSPTRSVQLISHILESIVSEKRTQFSSRAAIEIDLGLTEKSYGLFAEIEPQELKRVISNLINNSVDAISDRGLIRVQLDQIGEDYVRIAVVDTGAGIPSEILGRLGERGVTAGDKSTDSGSGLGIFHAKTTVESWGGKFSIETQVGQGTSVNLILNKAKPPAWFVERIRLDRVSKIVILDDDTSIHESWKGRFKKFSHNVELVHLSSTKQFEDWKSTDEASLYLFDYELLNDQETGLDLIEKYGLREKAVLVTSHFEETKLQERCLLADVGLIPKALAAYIPIVH